MEFLRWIAIWICVPIYKTIPKMYSIFYFLSNARFLSDGVIDELSKNLYVLVSVVMLFAFSASLLAAIVNPDLLSDKKKGFWAVFKRAVIGIVLIVAIPFLFDLAYELQGKIMQNSVIEKVILGINYADDTNTLGSDGNPGKGGQVIAGNLIKSVLYPISDEVSVEVEDLGDDYNEMVSSDISKISKVAKHINVAPSSENNDEEVLEEEYAFNFDGLIAIVAGGITVYILLLFALDMAVRMFKLAFLELTAPISIMAYIASGDEIFSKWRKEVLHTYLDVFIRVAAMGFYLFLISNLTTFFNSSVLWGAGVDKGDNWLSQVSWTLLLQVIIIVGMLIFVKQIPDLINRAFGTNYKPRGGIGGRLGEMAAVGDIAKKGWGTLTKAAGRVAGVAAVGTAAVGTLGLPGALNAGAALFAAHHGWNKGFDGGKAGKDTAVGRKLRQSGAWLTGGTKGLNEFNEKDPEYQNLQYQKQQKENQNIKDAAKLGAQNNANNVAPGLYITNPATGKLEIDRAKADSLVAAGTSDNDFKNMVENSGFSRYQKDQIINYVKKNDDKKVAENEQSHFENIKSNFSNAISASSGADAATLLDMQKQFDSGYNLAKLATDLQSIGSMCVGGVAGGALNATALDIIKSASVINNGSGMSKSKKDLDNKLTATTAAFTAAESDYNNMVDKEANESKKQSIKQTTNVGKEIGKSKIV